LEVLGEKEAKNLWDWLNNSPSSKSSVEEYTRPNKSKFTKRNAMKPYNHEISKTRGENGTKKNQLSLKNKETNARLLRSSLNGSFDSVDGLKRELRSARSMPNKYRKIITKKKKLKCNICQKSFGAIKPLLIHNFLFHFADKTEVIAHYNSKLEKCPFCSFSKKRKLLYHMRRTHINWRECPVCYQKFTAVNHMLVHLHHNHTQ